MVNAITQAFVLFFGWVLRVFSIAVIVIAWLAFLGFWTKIGEFSLAFIQGSLSWAIGLTVGGFILLALGIVMSPSSRRATRPPN